MAVFTEVKDDVWNHVGKCIRAVEAEEWGHGGLGELCQ